jgi:S1-C subfamily serine protease
VGFAIGAAAARPIIESLIEFGRVIRPMIGFNGQDVTPAVADWMNLEVAEGVVVTRIPRGSPAYEAGIRLGDVVTRIDGIPVRDVENWLKLLWSYNVGDEINVEFMRLGEVFNTLVTLAERVS